MNDEPKIRLSKDLADVIDQYRETLSREEFIDLCVRTFLKEQGTAIPEKIKSIQEEKVPRKETPEPAREGRMEGPSTVTVQQPAQRVVREVRPVVQRTPVRTQTQVEVREFPGSKYINETGFIVLWLAAVGFYGLGDLVTTHYALQLGLVEANPIAAMFKNIINMALFKVATIIAAFLISYTVFNTKTLIYSAPAMMLIAGLVLTINNALKIMHVL